MRKTFKHTHVLVTGAASGIGRATAIELARRGARVTLVDINEDALGETEALVGAVSRERLRRRVVDLGDGAAVDDLGARVLAEDGVVDVLVSNAGVAVVAPFTETSADDWSWVLGVNVLGPLRLTRAILPKMLEQKRGHLVFVASLAGLVAAPGMVAYGTSKFAMVGFAEALRLELAGSGVDVSTICPGYVRTNLSKATRYRNEAFRRFLDTAPSFYGMTSESVAVRLANAVETNDPLVVLGPEKVSWWLKRALPEASFQVSKWTAKLSGIGGTKEAACTSR